MKKGTNLVGAVPADTLYWIEEILLKFFEFLGLFIYRGSVRQRLRHSGREQRGYFTCGSDIGVPASGTLCRRRPGHGQEWNAVLDEGSPTCAGAKSTVGD